MNVNPRKTRTDFCTAGHSLVDAYERRPGLLECRTCKNIREQQRRRRGRGTNKVPPETPAPRPKPMPNVIPSITMAQLMGAR